MSICFNGFSVNLPCLLGVSSPNLSATNACAYSWKVIAINIPGIAVISAIILPGVFAYCIKLLIINTTSIIIIVGLLENPPKYIFILLNNHLK